MKLEINNLSLIWESDQNMHFAVFRPDPRDTLSKGSLNYDRLPAPGISGSFSLGEQIKYTLERVKSDYPKETWHHNQVSFDVGLLPLLTRSIGTGENETVPRDPEPGDEKIVELWRTVTVYPPEWGYPDDAKLTVEPAVSEDPISTKVPVPKLTIDETTGCAHASATTTERKEVMENGTENDPSKKPQAQLKPQVATCICKLDGTTLTISNLPEVNDVFIKLLTNGNGVVLPIYSCMQKGGMKVVNGTLTIADVFKRIGLSNTAIIRAEKEYLLEVTPRGLEGFMDKTSLRITGAELIKLIGAKAPSTGMKSAPTIDEVVLPTVVMPPLKLTITPANTDEDEVVSTAPAKKEVLPAHERKNKTKWLRMIQSGINEMNRTGKITKEMLEKDEEAIGNAESEIDKLKAKYDDDADGTLRIFTKIIGILRSTLAEAKEKYAKATSIPASPKAEESPKQPTHSAQPPSKHDATSVHDQQTEQIGTLLAKIDELKAAQTKTESDRKATAQKEKVDGNIAWVVIVTTVLVVILFSIWYLDDKPVDMTAKSSDNASRKDGAMNKMLNDTNQFDQHASKFKGVISPPKKSSDDTDALVGENGVIIKGLNEKIERLTKEGSINQNMTKNLSEMVELIAKSGVLNSSSVNASITTNLNNSEVFTDNESSTVGSKNSGSGNGNNIIGNNNHQVNMPITINTAPAITQTHPSAHKAKGKECVGHTDADDNTDTLNLPANARLNADGSWSWEVVLQPGQTCINKADPRKWETTYTYRVTADPSKLLVEVMDMQGNIVSVPVGTMNHSLSGGTQEQRYTLKDDAVGEVYLSFTARKKT